jgi:hypothetical protein
MPKKLRFGTEVTSHSSLSSRKINSRAKKRGNGKKHTRVTRARKNRRKQRRISPSVVIRTRRRQTVSDPRVALALRLMRQEGASASGAARRATIKLETFRKGAGRFLYRSGPGKPWKARSEDQLRFSMTVLTSRGPLDVTVSDSRERKLLHDYNSALRMFRAGEDGADAALKAFEGKTVGGQKLVTDIGLLIELEEAGQLDFEGFYVAIGARR